ncbi:MAG: BrnT family toxin [Desulfovibrionales bacterium]|nr:BrnT family toxin [Desulfovibrionales bacterium]
MSIIDQPVKCVGFEWDRDNLLKNWEKHGVSAVECEQIFFNRPLITAQDEKHSKGENRFYALGHTDAQRYLFVVFTIRSNRIRVISARDMNKKERREYESL